MTDRAPVNQYKCDPSQYCKNALCCKSMGSSPIVTPGDFIRAGNLTGTSPREIWEKNGALDVFHYEHLPGFAYQVTLSLLHDPCPYLNGETFDCDIYEARPIMCEVSPYNLFLDGQVGDHLEVFSCLKDAAASPENLARASKLMEIVKKECLFVKGLMPQGYFARVFDPIKDFPALYARSTRLVRERDPDLRSKMAKAVYDSGSQMTALRKKAEETGSLDIGTHFYGRLLTPILHAVVWDGVGEFFGNLNGEILSFYSETTREREAFRAAKNRTINSFH